MTITSPHSAIAAFTTRETLTYPVRFIPSESLTIDVLISNWMPHCQPMNGGSRKELRTMAMNW